MVKRLSFFLAGFIIVFLLTDLPALAQMEGPYNRGIKLGPLKIRPFVGVMETYSDNIYQSYDGKEDESDYLATFSPGIQFLLPLRQHRFQLGYRADINKFNDFPENDYTNQHAGGELNLDFPGGLIFNISDYYSNSEVPRKWKKQPGVLKEDDPYREKPYQANDFNVQTKYNVVGRWSVGLRYNNYDYGYSENYDKSGDYKRNLYGGAIYYRLTLKTEALLEYNYSDVDYKTNNDYDNKNHTAYAGIGFDPTAKVSGYLKLGGVRKKYEKKYENTINKKDDTFDEFSTLVDLDYKISPYNMLTLKMYRAIDEDVDTNSPLIKSEASLRWQHIFGWNEKISLNADFGYGKDKYEEKSTNADGKAEEREDDRWYGGAGIDYAIQRYLTFGLHYTYTDNDSNFKKHDYIENRGSLKAVVAF